MCRLGFIVIGNDLEILSRLCDSGEIIGVKQAGVEQQALDWSVAGVPQLVIARIGNYLPTLLCFPCMDSYMLSLNGAKPRITRKI